MKTADKLAIAGLALLLFNLGLLLLSPGFGYEIPLESKPVPTLVGLLLGAGLVYFFTFIICGGFDPTRRQLFWIFGIGLAMRLTLFPSAPMLEDDYYRYLWDGAVVSSGLNPYELAPEAVEQSSRETGKLDPGFYALAARAPEVLARINHPHLSTVYPPLAQASFALAHLIKPWSLTAWKTVLLAFDLACLALLVLLLREAGLPLWGAAVYWWNPLLVKEIYNSAHMDLVILPFLLATLWFALKKRPLAAAVFLALATGVKLWPVILLPLIFRGPSRKPAELAGAAAVFVLLAAAVNLPLLHSWQQPGSGFAAYFESWEMNDAIFMLFLWFFKSGILPAAWAEKGARLFAFVVLAAWILWLNRSRWTGPQGLYSRSLYIVAALFFLSPTQFPWYYLWFLGFLSLNLRKSLILLTPLLSLYYLRFYFSGRGMVDVFDYWIVWLEYLPVFVLMGLEWLKERESFLESSFSG